MCQQFHQFLRSEESKILLSKIKHIQIKKIIYIYFGFLIICSFFGKSYGNDAKEDYFFEVQFGNLIVGKTKVSLIKDEKKLRVKAKTKTAGFLNTFYEYQGELSSWSLKNGASWKPHKFTTNGFFKNKNRISELNWDKDNSVSYKIDPVLDLKEVHDIDKSTLNKVIDPLTSIINVIESIKNTETCDQSFKIFDGRRRYDLKINMKALEFINLYLEHFNNDDFDSLKSFFAYPLYMNVNGNIITVNESPMEQMKKSSDLGKTEDIEVEVIKETEDQAHVVLRNAKRYNKSGEYVESVTGFYALHKKGNEWQIIFLSGITYQDQNI